MENLGNTVIANDFCIGCGVCAYKYPNILKISETDGFYKAIVTDKSRISEVNTEICPFSGNARNENELAEIYLPDASNKNQNIGKYISLYAGHVENRELRMSATSGGIVRWVLKKLFENKMIDGAIHVISDCKSDDNRICYEYKFDESKSLYKNTAHSAYYPVEMSHVLEELRLKNGKIAITGLPCFIKAIRLLMINDAVLREKIPYTIGIVCGHLKSMYYAEMIGLQLEIQRSDLKYIDFRKKIKGKRASEKGITAVAVTGEEKNMLSSRLFGVDYGIGLFKPKACDYCDDVLAETADISVGDAWIPGYVEDSLGNSIVVVRNKELEEIVKKGIEEKELNLDPVPEKLIETSQAGGLRHRREGLAYRLSKARRNNEWVPLKRTEPNSGINRKRMKIYDLRTWFQANSTTLFRDVHSIDDFNAFKKIIRPKIKKYKALYKPFFIRVIFKILRIFGWKI